jgi:hypothetical protein
VPDKGMAVNLLAVRGCILGNGICAIKGKIAAGWFSGFPFHSVLRCDGSEISFIVNNLPLSWIIANSQSGAKKLPSFGDNGTMESIRLTRTMPGFMISAMEGNHNIYMRRTYERGVAEIMPLKAKTAATEDEKCILTRWCRITMEFCEQKAATVDQNVGMGLLL